MELNLPPNFVFMNPPLSEVFLNHVNSVSKVYVFELLDLSSKRGISSGSTLDFHYFSRLVSEFGVPREVFKISDLSSWLVFLLDFHYSDVVLDFWFEKLCSVLKTDVIESIDKPTTIDLFVLHYPKFHHRESDQQEKILILFQKLANKFYGHIKYSHPNEPRLFKEFLFILSEPFSFGPPIKDPVYYQFL